MEKPPKVVYGVPVVGVVGDNFCSSYPVELTVKKKCHPLYFKSTYDASDETGKLLLQVTRGYCIFQKKRVVRDAAGCPLLTLREKLLSWHSRWTAHKGTSDARNELLFGVKKTNLHRITRSKHEVFLPGNAGDGLSNFVVVETRRFRSYKAYRGDTLIAEVDFALTWTGVGFGVRKFKVKVYPGVDHAFVVALVVILNENDIALF